MAHRLFILFLFVNIKLSAQSYPAEILNYTIECQVDSKGKLTVKKYISMKINSPLGRTHGDIEIYYDNKSLIKAIEVSISTVRNELIKTFRKKEISDYSRLSGYFHTDVRYKEVKAYHNEYPYLIELSYTQVFSEFFSFPVWHPQNGTNIPTAKSSYKISVPVDYTFHNGFYNFEPKVDVQINETSKTYFWQTENILPIFVQESFLPPFGQLYPTARFVPDNFTFGNLTGVSKTWKDIGNWQSNLISGLDELPETEVKKVKELTKYKESEYEKVKVIFEYLQKETRYVGVFIGIGKWKPYNATYVCNNKYGDCKALTNYMMAMLKAINIKSYYSLIVAGENEADVDTLLPGFYFNHTVLCVPIENDTLWLECTSQDIPFNYWGAFTSGKHALVCNYENSYITQTPQFDKKRNCINQKSSVSISGEKLIVDLKRELFGESFESIKNAIEKKTDKNISDVADKTLPFENYSITNVGYNRIDTNGITGYLENLQLTFPNNIQKYSSNLIISPFNVFFRITHPLIEKRKNPISILHNFKISDTTNYNIPLGYRLDVIPDNFQILTKYGTCIIRYVYSENQLIVSKIIELNKGVYPLVEYTDFKSFVNAVINLENQKILLKKL